MMPAHRTAYFGRWSLAVLTIITTVVALVGLAPARRAVADTDCDRSRVVTAWQYGGSPVHAAEQALLGSDADVCAFLSTVWPQRQAVDLQRRG
jgi:hypothetical protein